jgi:hypothetical protein
MQTTMKDHKDELHDSVVDKDSGLALGIARATLGYLAMDDELKKRMELASGEIRVLGDHSNSTEISENNKRQVEEFEMAFSALKNSTHSPRELEILAEMLVDVCVDIICECSRGGETHS